MVQFEAGYRWWRADVERGQRWCCLNLTIHVWLCPKFLWANLLKISSVDFVFLLWELPGKKDSMVFVSLTVSLSLCLFCLCLCLCVSWSKLDQWLDPQCGLDSRVHPLTRSLNTVHSFISFHIPGIEAWNTNNMQICGSLALFKTRPVCAVGKRALLSQAHRLGLPTHPADSVPCLTAPSHTSFSSQPNLQEVLPLLYLLNSRSKE